MRRVPHGPTPYRDVSSMFLVAQPAFVRQGFFACAQSRKDPLIVKVEYGE